MNKIHVVTMNEEIVAVCSSYDNAEQLQGQLEIKYGGTDYDIDIKDSLFIDNEQDLKIFCDVMNVLTL